MKSSVILGSAALLFFVILLADLDFTAAQDASQTNAPTKGHIKPQSRGSDVDDFIPYQGIRYNAFDWMLLRSMNKRYKGNILISPISLKLALVLLYEGAQYETAEELAGVLQLPISYSATRERFGNILQSLKAPSPDYKLNVGTQVYIDEDHPARQLYRAIVKMFYESDVYNANFSEPQTIAEQANNWVYNITEGNIPTMIKNSDSLQSTVMLILNAMFFKGFWRHKYFKPENTQIRQFYVDNNTTVDVPYMQGVGQFYYAESPELNAKILRIPYAGQKFAMYLLLPYSSNGADSLLDRLDPFVLNKHVWLMHETQVYVSIPKFKFTFSSHLKEVLRELGIQSIFTDTAMLSGIARTKADSMRLKVSDVFQKTGIDVNENGTTAYAATEVQVVNKFGAEDFNVDHPFVFYIEDETTGTTLYAGKISNPLEVERSAEAPRPEFPEAPSAASAEKSNTEKPSTG